MLSDSALRSSLLHSRVVQHHSFYFAVLSVSGVSGTSLSQKMLRYVERIGTHRREKSVRSKRNPTILCPAGPQTPPTQTQTQPGERGLDRWDDLLETLGVFSALSAEGGEFRQTAAGASRPATDHR